MQNRGGGLVGLSLTAMVFNVSFYVATSLIVLYFKDIGMSAFLIGLSMTITRFGYGISSMGSEAMADRVGRSIPMFIGFLLGALSSFLLSFTKNQILAALLVLLIWVGSAVYNPAAIALVSDISNSGKAMPFSLYYFFVTVGQIIGQTAAGIIIEGYGYRAAFLLSSFLSLIAAIMVRLWFWDEKRDRKTDVIGDLVRGVRIMAENRYLRCLAIALSLHGIGFTMSYTFIPLVARADQKLNDSQIGLILSIWSLGNLIGMIPLGKITDKIGGKKMLVYHLAASSVVWWMYPFVQDMNTIAALMLVQGIVGAMDLPARRMILVGISEREVATAIGSLDSITFLVSSIGNLLAGLTWGMGHWVPFVLGSIINLAGLFVLLLMR
ncbi:MAG: MFS transporter [Candidatus Methanodesulfokora washburnensis]